MVGADGFALLDAVHAADAPVWLRQVRDAWRQVGVLA